MDIFEEMEKWDKEDAHLAIEREIPQFILRYKQTLANNFEKKNPAKYYCLRKSEGRFGLSESLVNQLMVFAYELGCEHGERKGKEVGYEDAMNEVKEKLGF